TWKAVDACGNESGTVAQTITVRDNTPPTIGSPGAAATIDCPATPTFTAPTANDACSSASVVLVSDISAAGTCTGTYTRTQTWKAVDACGNQSGTVAQTITVRDNTPPTIGSPGAAATIDCPATPTFTPPTASDACNSASVVQVSDVTTAGTCTGTYSETRTWKAVDNCGNQSGTVSQTITVRDNTPPTIGSPGAAATIDCPATPTFTAPTANDACNSASVVLVSDISAAGTCTGTYTRTQTWKAVDACGNQSGTVAQTITVRDNTPPTIGSPGAAATIDCPATPTFTPPTASDACNSASVVQVSDVTTAGTCTGTYSETRTWKAVDNCGNQSGTVSQTITVRDNTPPTIGSPGAAATIDCPATPTFTAPTANDACNSASVVLVSDISAAGTCTGTYTRTQTWKAVDACGNQSGTVAQTITVRDNTPPTIGSPGAAATIDCPATPTFTPPTASDACNSASVVQVSDVTTAGTCTGTYSETRTWKAVDNCGNQSGTVSQTITVRDNTPPTIGSPGAAATIDCPATPTFTAPTANDACNSASVVLVSDISAAGTCTGTYTRTQTWKAVDACGNQSGTVAQTITVRDNTPPTIGSPGAAATIDCPATPTFTAPTANDACSSASVVLVSDISAAGTCTGTYTRTQTWKAVDACGNQSGTVAQTITVRDNTPPTIGSPGAAATIDCPATPTFTAPTANDACSSASVVLVSDISAAGTCTGTYTRTQTWKAVDACGNQSGTVAQTITVRDNTPPTIGSAGAAATIDCPATPTFTAPTANDACSSASVVLVSDISAAGTCTGTYTRTQTWKAVDACGNQSGTVAQTITVRDNTPPTIGSPGAAATIDCPATPTFTAPTANDACSSASVVLVSDISAAGTCTGTYTRTQTWKAVDACGNQSGTVAQTITVRDNTPPTIGSAGAAATIDCPATPTFTAPTANDACSSASVVLVSDISAAGTCTGTYTRTQTWKAVDACGNQSGTVAQTITVRDNTPPTIGSPGAAATIDCPATPTFTAPTANDACSSASVVLVSDISAAGTCTGTYTRTQTWKAVDACGNQSGTVAQTITVRDNTPPTIGSPGAAATIDCPATPTFTAPTANDACSAASVVLVSDISAAGTCTGTYTRTQTWKAVDACGNQSGTVAQTITGRENTPPTIGLPGGDGE